MADRLPEPLQIETLYSNRLVYTAYCPDNWLEVLYLIVEGGPIIVRSAPLDRILALSYPGGCFGMRNLPIGYGRVAKGFPSQVEAYKTTSVIKLPLAVIQTLYQTSEVFHDRYDRLFELREKFQISPAQLQHLSAASCGSIIAGVSVSGAIDRQPAECRSSL